MNNCSSCKLPLNPGNQIQLKVCQHWFCRACLRVIILNPEKSEKVPCPLAPDCKGNLSILDIQGILPRNEYLSYMKEHRYIPGGRKIPEVGKKSPATLANTNTKETPANDITKNSLKPELGNPETVERATGSDRIPTVLIRKERNKVEEKFQGCSASSNSQTTGVIPEATCSNRIIKPEIKRRATSISKESESGPTPPQMKPRLSGKLPQHKPEETSFLQHCPSAAKRTPISGVGNEDNQSCSTSKVLSNGTLSLSRMNNEIDSEVNVKNQHISCNPTRFRPRTRAVKKSSQKEDSFFYSCVTPNCSGICIPESSSVIFFICQICHCHNCLNCKAIHEGIPCSEWKKSLSVTSDNHKETVVESNPEDRRKALQYNHSARSVYEVKRRQAENSYQDVECAICYLMTSDEETGGPFELNNCHHVFCRSCLQQHIGVAESQFITCPYSGEDGQCEENLSPGDISALSSEEVKQKHLRWNWSLVENAISNRLFACLDRRCEGFWEISDSTPLGVYICPACRRENCVLCNALHEEEDCQSYQEKLRQEAARIRAEEERRRDEENRQAQMQNEIFSETEVQRLIGARQFMRCPHCQYVCERISGCAHMTCYNRACGKQFNWYS